MKRRRGIALMITLTTITVLIAILQQVAFDSRVEFESGAAQYHSLKAYHAAKSGIELALLKTLIYKKIVDYLKEKSKNPQLAPIIKQYESYTHLIWSQPLIWPPITPIDATEVKKAEMKTKISESSFQKISYKTEVIPEVAKLNLMDIVSPTSKEVRDWAKDVFYNLLINIREKNQWFQDNYSINNLRELIVEVEKMLNPSIWNTTTQTYSIHQLDDLKHIENINPEWVEWIRPYVTLYSEGGIHIQFTDPLTLQSLHSSLTDEQVQKMIKQKQEEEIYLSSFDQMKLFFTQNGADGVIQVYEEGESPLKDFVLSFNPPQIFKIKSQGISGNVSRQIEVVLYDSKHIFEKTYKAMNYIKEKTNYSKPTKENDPVRFRNNAINHDRPLSLKTSPFIIHWKDIN